MSGRDEIRGHEFDGIEEYDNPLPNWWLWTFYGACIFAVAYWGYYEVFNGPNLRESYEAQVVEQNERIKVLEASQNPLTEESLLVLVKDPEAVKLGKKIFAGQGGCLPCHGAKLEGVPGLGVNLTDDAWKHGPRAMQIYQVIHDGVSGTSMPPHKTKLGRDRIEKVVAYLLSPEVKNTNVKGRPPEGKSAAEWEKEGK
ncbi:MAG: cytochrome oxidase subunit III [Planctomycetota bacterium]|nr:MAG: cytochrome oxidase subunit III [Planctomycetota bacterium]